MAANEVGSFPGEALLGDSPAHRLLKWYLGRIAAGNPEGLAEEIESRFGPETNPAVVAGFMSARFDDLRGFRLVEVLDRSDATAISVVETPAGVGWRVFGRADPVSGRFLRVGSAQAPRPGVTVRRAEPDDGPRIADLVRVTPVSAASGDLLLDYGPDYLAATAMAQDRVTLIAERGGLVVGLHGFARVDLRYRDEVVPFEYLRHTRVRPEAKGSGVFSALNGALAEISFEADHVVQPASLVVLGNDAMLTHIPSALRTWGVPWERFHLDVPALAGGTPPGAVDDLQQAVSLIVAAQGVSGLGIVTSPEWLARRLTSTPSLYGQHRLLGNHDAVLGVGARGIVVKRTSSGRPAHREAVAYDVGMAPGAGPALVEVLRGWCSVLAAEGVERLAVACGAGAPVRGVLDALATEKERFLLNCGLAPPDGVVPSIAFDHALM